MRRKRTLLFLAFFFFTFASVHAVINDINVEFFNFGTYSFPSGDANYLLQNFDNVTSDSGTWSYSAGSDELTCTTVSACVGSSNPFIKPLERKITIKYGTGGGQEGDEYQVYLTDTGFNPGTSPDGNGYAVFFRPDSSIGAFTLTRYDNGSPTALITNTGLSQGGTDYNLTVVRDNNGEWTLFRDGSKIGNSAVDLNYALNTLGVFSLSYDGAGSSTNGFFHDANIFQPIDTEQKYVHTLDYNVSYNCVTVDANVQFAVDDVNQESFSLNCDNSNKTISDSYTHPTEGPFNTKFWSLDFNNAIQNLFSDTDFISDLNAPIPDLNFSTITQGFSASTTTLDVFLTCVDTVSPSVHYDLNNSTIGMNAINANYDANTTQEAEADLTPGFNLFDGSCTDLAGNSAIDSNSINVSFLCFDLINEDDGTNLSTADLNQHFNAFKATSYTTSTTFNFLSPLTTEICYTAEGNDVIRFDMNYFSGVSIFKEFNLSLMQVFTDTNTIGVCVAPEQSLFTQDFISSTNQAAIVEHSFYSCFSLGDYTKFNLQDALYHTTFTINAPYNVTTYDGNNVVQLGNLDGSTASTINLDVLILKKQQYTINIVEEQLSIYKDGNSTITFQYLNQEGDNLSSKIEIFDGATLVFNSTNTSSPNSWSVVWNISAYEFQNTVLSATITNTKLDGSIETLEKYFTPDAASGIIDPGFAALLAVLFFFFTFTLLIPRFSLNWFGLLICIVCIGFLSLAPAVWFITLLQASFAIVGIATFLIYKEENIGWV